MSVLIFIYLIVLFLVCGKVFPLRGFRYQFLSANLLWAASTVVFVELLSIPRALTSAGVAIVWLSACLILWSVIRPPVIKLRLPEHIQKEWPSLLILSIILTLTLVTALLSPPNNWDSMSYHASRIEHWIQNRTVAFYPTHIERQLWAGPAAEFLSLPLHILHGSDRLAGFIQWWAMALSLIGISMLARLCGANRHTQLLAAVITATLPMGILQSTGTQNDYVLTSFLIAFIYYALHALSSLSRASAFLSGVALGLACLTKGSAYIFAAPFVIAFGIGAILKDRRTALRIIPLVAGAVLLLTLGQITRTYRLFGHPLSPPDISRTLVNEPSSIQATVSNIIRNSAFQLGSPFPSWNRTVEKAVYGIHDALGLDIQDPASTLGEHLFKFTSHPFHEDHSSNAIHFLLLLITLPLFFVLRVFKRYPGSLLIVLCTCIAFLLINVSLKWQPWGSRLILPFSILSLLGIALTLDALLGRKTIIIAAGLAVACLPWLLQNQSRPLIGNDSIFKTPRDVRVFANNPGMRYSYTRAVETVKESGCRNIGLVIGVDSWEYPLWPLLRASVPGFRLEHVNVTTPSRTLPYPAGDFKPCMILHDSSRELADLRVGTTTFRKMRQTAFLGIFVADEASENLAVKLIGIFEDIRKANREFMDAVHNGGSVTQSLRMYIEIYALARTVPADDLKKNVPGLAEVWEAIMNGLALIEEGIQTENQDTIHEGLKYLLKVEAWFTENRSKMGIS